MSSPNTRDWYPMCFVSRREYSLWLSRAAAGEEVTHSSYCTDCTPEYQTEMMLQERCEHPDVTFFEDADGFLYGRRPPRPRVSRRKVLEAA